MEAFKSQIDCDFDVGIIQHQQNDVLALKTHQLEEQRANIAQDLAKKESEIKKAHSMVSIDLIIIVSILALIANFLLNHDLN